MLKHIIYKMSMSSVDPCILIYGDRGIHLRLRATEQSSYIHGWYCVQGFMIILYGCDCLYNCYVCECDCLECVCNSLLWYVGYLRT